MARNFKFRSYLKDIKENYSKNKAKEKQKQAVNFVKKYKPLLSEGKYDQFDLDEEIMTVKEALKMSTTEALTSRDAAVLVTTIIEGALQEAAEPMYVATELFDTVQVDNNNRIIFPAIGQLRAEEIAEGGSYPQDQLDIVLREGATEVDVTKKGVLIPITHEMIEDSQWEVKAA